MQDNDRTYYDDEKLLNANITSKAAKAAKLSSIKNFRAKTDAIKEQLRSEMKKEEPSVETPAVETAQEIPATPETPTVEPVKEEVEVSYPTKEVLEAKTINNTFYKELENSKNESEISYRKLRVAPQVVKSLVYTTKTLGVDYVPETKEVKDTTLEPNVNMGTAPFEETPKAFDFSALPGVGETSTNEESYGDYHNSEQDNRLNDYLNRENGTEDIATNLSEIEEIRKLKREIEEARESLQQVKANVGDLHQKDNAISEQLAMYKQSLMEQRDQVNAELVDQTREWNDLTQLVKQKEALMGENESFGMNKAA